MNSLVSTGASSGVHFCKTIAGILSGPEALEESNPVIILDTSETVKLMLERVDSVRLGNSGNVALESSIFELVAKSWANRSALSLADVNTSGPLMRYIYKKNIKIYKKKIGFV